MYSRETDLSHDDHEPDGISVTAYLSPVRTQQRAHTTVQKVVLLQIC